MMIYAQINRFCLTFLRKMAQILNGGVMNLCNLNIKKGKLNMNKTEFVEAVAKEAISRAIFMNKNAHLY